MESSDNEEIINMNVITYSQLNELVMKLPAGKLSLAYSLLADLTKKEGDEILSKSDFMSLPLNERRRLMAQQALDMISHYERDSENRQTWQAGDFADEY